MNQYLGYVNVPFVTLRFYMKKLIFYFVYVNIYNYKQKWIKLFYIILEIHKGITEVNIWSALEI